LQTNPAAVGNIVSQATDMLLTARAENSEVDIENLIRKNMDVIAIMGHISYDLAQPWLNGDVMSFVQHSIRSMLHEWGRIRQTMPNTTEPHTGIE
jgi:hypothetical protein